jgi:protocatechuate 3,4-dioxygenase beta subunit
MALKATFNVNVYFDANDDGIFDAGDSDLQGVTVNLWDGPTGTTATTDANGDVSFTSLVAGSYKVSVDTPAS